MNAINKRVLIQGIVQGVGFRPTAYGYAKKYGLTGWILNSAHGVEIEVHGEPQKLDGFLRELRENPPRMAQIDTFQVTNAPTQAFSSFEIIESRDDPSEFLPVSPDLNICPDCQRELFDPTDHRYLYPFINCTNCGPRFSIVSGIPYDRPNTSMSAFPLCPDCANEYHDPSNRRFHAQPVACPVCGPHIWLQVGRDVLSEKEDALRAAREMIKDGKILAVKGLGGFHLVCDANNAKAVEELRHRKRRSGKPFAVMSFDLGTINEYCWIGPEEKTLLKSAQAPIVLLELTEKGQNLAKIVAPDQNTLGFMLPYTPLHYLLLEKKLGYPEVLVMTSANLSEEPIVTENEEALEKLVHIADAYLMHNRPIETRIDDSVVSTFRGQVYFNRRARGYAPNPVRLPFQAPPSLATGTHLKNTFTIGRDHYAFVSHHIGDLDNQETWAAYTQAIEHYKEIFRIRPEMVACDLHPDYMATRYAALSTRGSKIPLIPVQHHHAHICSCLADNGWNSSEPVIGLSFDGTGYGPDNTIWGGEILLASYHDYQRRFHLEYVPLPGGEASIKKPARLALGYLASLALLDKAEGLAPLVYLSEVEQQVVVNQTQTGFNSPLTSSMGRLFDAVAALIGLYQEISYEAQNAIRLEAIADPDTQDAYDLPLEKDQILLQPLFRAIIEELKNGSQPEVISAKFHNGIVKMALTAAEQLRKESGVNVVALSGGVWQNKLLLQKTVPALEKAGFTPLWHHQVPTNDGGVSLGQLVSALFQSGLVKE